MTPVTSPRYNGTPVRRIFNDEGSPTGFTVFPDSKWDDHDLVLWTLSLVNNETGLSIGAQGPDTEGKYILKAEFLTGEFPPTDVPGVSAFLLGVLSGYVAASHGFGVLGRKSNPTAGFADMFGGLFR